MTDERRRYFRIHEKIGICYWPLGVGGHDDELSSEENIEQQEVHSDKRIEQLLGDMAGKNPKVAEVLDLLHKKIQRLNGQFVMDGGLLERVASRLCEANISACGMAFINDEPLARGNQLAMELTLLPSKQKIRTKATVVSCESQMDSGSYYCRVDFFGMSSTAQERLIQHMVKTQSSQLQPRDS